MASMYGTEEAAAALGVTPGRVRQLARQRNVGTRISGSWVFTDEDIEAMRRPARRGPAPKPKPPCSVEGCENQATARGLCAKHYQATWRRERKAARDQA